MHFHKIELLKMTMGLSSLRSPLVWECHDGHNGVVIAGTDKNIHGQIVTIDPKRLDPNTAVMRF
jgi:hypothetical protein